MDDDEKERKRKGYIGKFSLNLVSTAKEGRCVEVGLKVVEEGASYVGISTSGTFIWERLRIRSEHHISQTQLFFR